MTNDRRTRKLNPARLLPVGIILLTIAIQPGRAGGPRSVDGTGQAMRWNNAAPILYNVDPGSLGTLTHLQAGTLLADAFDRWQSLPNVQLDFAAGPDLPQDVNAAGLPSGNPAHWGHFWRKPGDGLSPVIYDGDGSITDDMFGVGARFDILGAAALDTPISLSGTITEASIILNGTFLDGAGLPASPDDSPSQLAFEATMVHEVGHFLNFDHSMVNHEVRGDGNGDNDVYLPTMFPLTVENEEALASPNPDDIAGAIALYPAPGAATATWSISGMVSAGGVPFQGAEVIVRSASNPLLNAYEAISGARYFPCNVGGACYPCDASGSCSAGNPPAQGTYSIAGMSPGSYTVRVEQLDRRIALDNGTFIGPLATPPVLPGPEECYDNGESADPAVDNPDTCTPLPAAAGGSFSGVDLLINDFRATDPYEPNNTLGSATSLPQLNVLSTDHWLGAVLGPGDLDVYSVSVQANEVIQIDLDAIEIGSLLDPVIGLYNNSGALIQVVDDGVDPDSGMQTPDPTIEFRPNFTGSLRIVVTSYPDLDLDGTGGASSGPYWLKIRRDFEGDGDGILNAFDICPIDRENDIDKDGICGNMDNCRYLYNPGQQDSDFDDVGDACESGRILSPLPTWTGTGAGAGAHFGHALIDAGDFNGDTYEDVVIGEPGNPDLGPDPGGPRLTFYRGAPYGLQDTGTGFVSGYIGKSAAPVGDFNNDGFDDFVFTDTDNGDVYLMQGDPTNVIWRFDLSPFHSSPPYGNAVAKAGDVNGDGVEDLLIQESDQNTVDLYLFNPTHADPDTLGVDWFGVSPVPGTTGFGSAMAGGDVNLDAYGDVLIGAPTASNGQSGEGAAYLFLGSPSGPSISPDWSAEGNEAGADFGRSVAIARDINGEPYSTYADVIVGAPLADGAGTDRGKVFIYEGSDTGPSLTPLVLSDDQDNAHFGASVATGDINGDGYDDVVVGAPNHNAGGTERGRVYLYLGNAGGLGTVPAAVLDGEQDYSHFGDPVATADTNRTGYPEILVAAQDFDTSTTMTDAGKVYLFTVTDGRDRDGDSYGDEFDNCPDVANPTQQDSDSPKGPDGLCGTPDDNPTLRGLDGVCGTSDDVTGDGVGDACIRWNVSNPLTSQNLRSTGGAWVDFDGDGDLDLWLTGTSTAPATTEKLLRNDGGETFTDVTPGAMASTWAAGAWADYDHDGDPDLWTVGGAGLPSRLLKNLGSGSFSAVTIPSFLGVNSVAWVDYDQDLDLDAYVTAGSAGGRFYRNDGNDTFALVSMAPLNTLNHSTSAWADFDNDGDQDVLTGGTNCKLYGDTGGAYTLAQSVTCSNADWGDYDNDGDLDAHLGFLVIRNLGGGTSDILQGLDTAGTVRHFVDIDNDGDLDVVTSSSTYLTPGNQAFVPVREAAAAFSRMIPADFDEDGRVDLFLPTTAAAGSVFSRLLRNTRPTGGHWLEVDLRGTVSNRDGIGAQVRATTGGITRMREVTSLGHAWQAPRRLHFGLGTAGFVDSLEIRWPSGAVQTLLDIAVDQRIVVQEAAGSSLVVSSVLPPHGSVDVSLYTNVILTMNHAIDPATANAQAIVVSKNGVKVDGDLRVSADRFRITFDPDGPLDPDSDYAVQVSAGVKDLFYATATPFTSAFDTGSAAGSVPLPAGDVGSQQSGSIVGGVNQDERSGFAAAAVGDVNGDGLADLVTGSPNADDGASADAGTARLIFGQAGLQSGSETPLMLEYVGEGAFHLAGRAVAAAGDMNGDGKADFLIGAPFAAPNGSDSGKAYLVFGSAALDEAAPATLPLSQLSTCPSSTLCGIAFEGEASGDWAGIALSAAGDINHDGFPDLLVASPGASPSGRPGAGKVYLIYGPLNVPGVIPLATVGVTQPGLVFVGENPGDLAGSSVSRWDQFTGDGIDDLLIGAPGADALDDFGATVSDAGYVYAIHGGTANLIPNPVSPATIELSRLANAAGDQVGGIVFIGASPGRFIGRSVSGAVDINGDNVPDICIGAHGEAYLIPGNGPKTQSGTSKVDPHPTITPTGLIRALGHYDALQNFGATFFTAGTEGELGDVMVAPAGDLNGDGIQDLVLGAAEADLPGKSDAGKAYVVFGSQEFPAGEVPLSEVGETLPGLVIQGAESGDHLGAAVGGGFDVNGDGLSDLILGAPFADTLPAAPADAGETYIISFGAPEEVGQLAWQPLPSPPFNLVSLEWDSADRAFSYNIYRGNLSTLAAAGALRTSDMMHLACGISTDLDADQRPDVLDTAIPALNDGFYYLVTGNNLSGESPIGPLNASPVRIHDSQCP